MTKPNAIRLWRYLVGDLTIKNHGINRLVGELARSLAALMPALFLTVWISVRREKTLVCIARNDHANASVFLSEYEFVERAHSIGKFGGSRVVFVVDRVPLGVQLWREISFGTALHFPRFRRPFRLILPSPFITRMKVYEERRSEDVRLTYTIPARRSPSRGGPQPFQLAERAGVDLSSTSPFVLMQCQRPAMYSALQLAAGRKVPKLVTGGDAVKGETSNQLFPDPTTYTSVASTLGQLGMPTVDLWKLNGNPADLISGKRQDGNEMQRDEFQTWLFANCEIFLSGASGSWWIAWALGRPTLLCDSYSAATDLPISMLVPVLLWDRVDKRILTLREMWSVGHGESLLYWLRKAPNRLEPIRNSAEEIVDAVLELRGIENGDNLPDLEIQSRVLNIFRSAINRPDSTKSIPLISQRFLAIHKDLIK